MGDGFVIKVAQCINGRWQNEAECNTYLKYKDLDLFIPIEDYDSNYLWVIERKTSPMTRNNIKMFKNFCGITFEEFRKELNRIEYDYRYKKISYEQIQSNYPQDSLIGKLCSYIIKEKIIFYIDFLKYDSYGTLDDKIYVIDYGMDNNTLNKYKRNNGRQKSCNMHNH
jgi:hypothetical protein